MGIAARHFPRRQEAGRFAKRALGFRGAPHGIFRNRSIPLIEGEACRTKARPISGADSGQRLSIASPAPDVFPFRAASARNGKT